MMVVSDRPLDPDPARLRRALVDYRIDGRKLLDPADPRQAERIEEIVASSSFSAVEGAADPPDLEACVNVLTRTRGVEIVTDDNMGEEWRYRLVREGPSRR